MLKVQWGAVEIFRRPKTEASRDVDFISFALIFVVLFVQGDKKSLHYLLIINQFSQ
jgi:hypothetical protein